MKKSGAEVAASGASAPTPAPVPAPSPAPDPAPVPSSQPIFNEYGIQGCLVRVNIPAYNTGAGRAVMLADVRVLVDLGSKHLAITSALGTDMLFHIHENRKDLKTKKVDGANRLSKNQCVELLQEFLNSKPDVRVCKIQTPYMSNISQVDPDTFDETGGIQIRGPHQSIALYDHQALDQERDAVSQSGGRVSSVFLSVYLCGNLARGSLEKLGVETRHRVERSDYCILGHPNSDPDSKYQIHPSRLAIDQVYSTFVEDPHTGQQNWSSYEIYPIIMDLKQASKQRLRDHIVNSLIQLAINNPLHDDYEDEEEEPEADYKIKQKVWIEYPHGPKKPYEIKSKVWIEKKKNGREKQDEY